MTLFIVITLYNIKVITVQADFSFEDKYKVTNVQICKYVNMVLVFKNLRMIVCISQIHPRESLLIQFIQVVLTLEWYIRKYATVWR